MEKKKPGLMDIVDAVVSGAEKFVGSDGGPISDESTGEYEVVKEGGQSKFGDSIDIQMDCSCGMRMAFHASKQGALEIIRKHIETCSPKIYNLNPKKP